MRPKHLSDLRRCLAANVITTTFKFADRLAFELFQRFLVRHISPLMWLTSTLLIEARHRRIVNICQVAHIRRYDVAHLLLLVTLGQDFTKILRGGSGFYKKFRPTSAPLRSLVLLFVDRSRRSISETDSDPTLQGHPAAGPPGGPHQKSALAQPLNRTEREADSRAECDITQNSQIAHVEITLHPGAY